MANIRQVYLAPESATATETTIAEMAKLVLQAERDPEFIELARSIVADLPSHCQRREIDAIFWWVADRVRYVQDPYGVELVQSPQRTIAVGAGDCDDLATLTAALLTAIGYPIRFVATGPQPDLYSHVWTEVEHNGRWIAVDHTAYGVTEGQAGYPQPLPVEWFNVWTPNFSAEMSVGQITMEDIIRIFE